MGKYDWLLSSDWNRISELEVWNTGQMKTHYRIMSTDLSEAEVRENMLYWDMQNVWSLFKVYIIGDDFMREIQANLPREDLRQLEHEIMIDCFLPRQCFIEQIENYLTYMRACTIQFEQALKVDNNKSKLLRRLERLHSSFSYDGEMASITDFRGYVTDQIVY